MEKIEVINLMNSNPTKNKLNKIKIFKMIGIILLTLLIILLIFNNLELYLKTKVLKKENELLDKEKESFINITKNIIQGKNNNIEEDGKIFEKYKYLKEYKLYRLLCPKEVIGKKKILLGEPYNASYVLLDDLFGIKIAYSFGIGNYISFDKALADKGIDIYMYDHTIQKLPYENPKFHWKKIGVTSESKKNSNMKTLFDFMKENGHLKEKNMILKIDVEASEWDVFQDITPKILNQFKYIIMEFHFYNIKENFNLYLESLEKLMKDHQIFHLHCCNCKSILDLGGENPICQVIEVSYIKREGNQFKKDKSNYPIKGLDFKICPKSPSLDKENIILKFCDNLY